MSEKSKIFDKKFHDTVPTSPNVVNTDWNKDHPTAFSRIKKFSCFSDKLHPKFTPKRTVLVYVILGGFVHLKCLCFQDYQDCKYMLVAHILITFDEKIINDMPNF